MTGISKAGRQFINILLQKRFTTREFNKLAIIFFDFLKDCVYAHGYTTRESELRIAPVTAQIATRCTDKDTRQPGITRFALNTLVNLRDSHSLYSSRFSILPQMNFA